MKRIAAAVLALIMLLALAACGAKEPEVDVAGTYYATSCYVDGEECPCDGEYVKLSNDGTGVVMFMEEEYDIDWTLSGEVFNFTDSEGDKMTGTLVNGVISGDYAGMEYVFDMNSGSSGKGKLSAAKEEAPAAEAAPEPAPEEELEPQALSGFEPVGADISDYYVEIVGAEAFDDSDGNPGIRFYYDFTNNSDESCYATTGLSAEASQDGYELVSTYASYADDVPEYGNDGYMVRPGVTVRCIEEYSFKPDGGELTFTVYDWWDEDNALTATFDAASLPGRPAVDWELEPISDPTWTEGMADAGEFDEAYVSIDNYEIVDGYSSDKVVRVYFTYTNNKDEASSLWWAVNVNCYQDGFGLESTYAEDDVPEDDNFTLDIEPGETITASNCYALRRDSPVEIEITDLWESDTIGMVVPVA